MRLEFDRKTKTHALKECGGRCDHCKKPLSTGYFHFDHVIPAWFEPMVPGCQVLCIECHKIKTAKDIKQIAKSKRIIKRHKGIRKPRRITGWRTFAGVAVRAPRER